jgi:maltooligosyltrehalose trehalohydrolase
MNVESDSIPLFGAIPDGSTTRFRIWAPGRQRVDVVVYGPSAEAVHALNAGEDGFFTGTLPGIGAGARYRLRLDGDETFPDPTSRAQPDGVHGPSEVVDHAAFRWSDAGWRGVPLERLSIYELHVGTFTPRGTFDAAIDRLDHLVDLGVTAVQLMPVAEFPGDRNWGYDGVYLFAPARAYGGATGLKRFVDAAHARGLAVLLDVVYNHFGPEGNYLPAVTSGRIFNEAHHTPWGAAVNFDGEGSAAVREMIVANALEWIHHYRIDGLRLDATHAILDDSEVHLLRELRDRVRATAGDRHVLLIAEDERNERALLLPPDHGGYGLDAVWADDLHHQLRRLTAGDAEGYFANYSGTVDDVVQTLRKGWFFEGQRYPSHDAPRGTPADGIPPARFVHTLQNHDQVGNRALGERLHHQVEAAVWRAASALLLFSPYTPLLFMGQEWSASTPFQYFTDHPEELGRLVTEGRREEFRHFTAFADPALRARIPDPQAPRTFEESTLRWDELDRPHHRGVLSLYRSLLRLRRTHPVLAAPARDRFEVRALGAGGLAMRRDATDGQALLLVCSFTGAVESPADGELLLWTESEEFGGSGPRPDLDAGRIRLPSAGAAIVALA